MQSYDMCKSPNMNIGHSVHILIFYPAFFLWDFFNSQSYMDKIFSLFYRLPSEHSNLLESNSTPQQDTQFQVPFIAQCGTSYVPKIYTLG